MANFLSQFVTDRFLKPAIDAEVTEAVSANNSPVYGTSVMQEVALEKAMGQPHDANDALFKLNTDG